MAAADPCQGRGGGATTDGIGIDTQARIGYTGTRRHRPTTPVSGT
ncbi:hypothetical protein SGLAM104S_08301 [Streptomyces glaucescens]